ncbi:hypothetical protein BOX15_Mlig018278g1 [Macrostomum lignano]|uniref:Methylosome subunit pICln n=1 Tax=Macrostomum lignano TaxID=282301 RepID=A0A267DS09_9PLAT|nr:hypothetical protein BOX15_Mlig018278g1 [Macrostomum lignano]
MDIATQQQQQQPRLFQHTQPDTEAWLGAECLGSGLLQINENCLTWSGPGRQFALPHSAVYAHALSKTGSGGASGRPHLLLMALLDGAETPEEIRLCPPQSDGDSLQILFSAMSNCQTILAAADNASYDRDFNGQEFRYEAEAEEAENEDDDDEDDGPDFDHLLVGDAGDSNGDQPMDTDQFEDAQ